MADAPLPVNHRHHMTIVKATSNKYGPATLDIQVEQGADFAMPLTLKQGGVAIPLTGYTFEAHMSTEWSPGGARVDFVVEVTDIANGKITVSLPISAQSAFSALPTQPKKTVDPTPFLLGDWVLNQTVGGLTTRLLGGKVWLARDPCLA